MGQAGLKVSPLCLGTVLYGDHVDEEASVDIMRRALDAGVNFFDTANSYNDGGRWRLGSLPGRGREVVIGDPPEDVTSTTANRAVRRAIERHGQDRELHPGL